MLALRRRLAAVSRRWREARLFAHAMTRPYAPVVAHLIPIRRCNLACTYCNEFDDHSPPVPLPLLRARVDRLAALGVHAITLSGGEPLLHPDIAEIVAHIRGRGLLASLITNGYLLSQRLIEALNDAGLDYLQLSVDNLAPDGVSMKSWRPLQPKLRWLSRQARFAVNVNLVIGIGSPRPEDALTIAEQARALGFRVTVGLAHDGWAACVLSPTASAPSMLGSPRSVAPPSPTSPPTASSSKTSSPDVPTTGIAPPALYTCMCASAASSTTAPSNAGGPASPSRTTRWKTAAANITARNPALPSVPYPASTKPPCSTSCGASPFKLSNAGSRTPTDALACPSACAS
jgi:hypothetical protein